MTQRAWSVLMSCAWLGCTGTTDVDVDTDTPGDTSPPTVEDTAPPGPSVDELCAGGGDARVTLGTGAGSEFVPLVDDDIVELVPAPQGGFGVSVRLSTWGLATGDNASALLETWRDGVLEGTFPSAGHLFCQDDGSGMLFDQVVGFDSALYPDNDDLIALDGEDVELIVTMVDNRGVEQIGRVTVEIQVGAD